MKTNTILLILIPVILLTQMFSLSCNTSQNNSQSYPYEVSFSKAEKRIGTKIPKPDYLPGDFKLHKVILMNKDIVSLFYISLSGEEIELKITWRSEGIIPWKVDQDAPTVEIGDNLAQLFENEDNNRIVWNWIPNKRENSFFIISLSYPKYLSISEIVKMADSLKLENE